MHSINSWNWNKKNFKQETKCTKKRTKKSPKVAFIKTINGLKRKLAERKGFEPLLRFHVNSLSKRAPSATQPPLRILILRLATNRFSPGYKLHQETD